MEAQPLMYWKVLICGEEIIKWSIVVSESSGSRQLSILKQQCTVSRKCSAYTSQKTFGTCKIVLRNYLIFEVFENSWEFAKKGWSRKFLVLAFWIFLACTTVFAQNNISKGRKNFVGPSFGVFKCPGFCKNSINPRRLWGWFSVSGLSSWPEWWEKYPTSG